MEAVLKLDANVRASYVDEITLDRYNLANTMLFDGCLLLELLICESKYDSELPIPFNGISPGIKVKQMDFVLSDLLLSDNQIPIYILEILIEITLGSSPQMQELIQNLALSVFGFSVKLKSQPTFHLLDIVYSYIEMRWIDKKTEENPSVIIQIDLTHPWQFSYNLYSCATRLKAVGITIQLLDIPTHINFLLTTYTEFNQSKRILKIQRLVITPTTEALWRSFIAWEHYKKKWEIRSSSVTKMHTPFSFSAMLFSDLICCPSDVQLLKDKGIIDDQTEKSNTDLVAFFHSIAMGVDRDIIYSNHSYMLYTLNTLPTANYATRIFFLLPHWCYHIYQFFKRNYNFAATILSFLTVVQTCYSVVSYHYPKK